TVISKARLTATANNKTTSYGGTAPPLNGLITGAIGSDAFTANYNAVDKTSSAPVRNHAITVDTVGPPEALANYQVEKVNGTLTINPATPVITLAGTGTFAYDALPHKATATIAGLGTDKL